MLHIMILTLILVMLVTGIGATYLFLWPRLKCNSNDLCFEAFYLSPADRATSVQAYNGMPRQKLTLYFETHGGHCVANSTELSCKITLNDNAVCLKDATYIFSLKNELPVFDRIQYGMTCL